MVGDEYEIDYRLGAGAMGEVYAARHVKLGKRVAIKVISPRLSADTAAVERFEQEARTLAQMRHPGLVDVLGFGELADGRAYFVMEMLSGTSLFDRLQQGRLDRDEAFDVFGQIARALEAAHTHGVVHRDLKPENIFLAQVTNERRPIVKLLDFGLARLEVDADRRVERTQSGVVIGTAMYLSPEQARGPDVDGRTDIYALACIGYELFLGRHPFQDERTIAALIAAHMHDTPALPRSIDPSIPPQLDLMLFAMLAKDSQHRPTLPQIRSVIEGMRTAPIAASSLTPTPTVTSEPERGTAGSINRRMIAVAIVVLGVGVILGAALRGSRSESDGRLTSAPPQTVDAGNPLAQVSSTTSDAPLVEVPLAVIDAAAERPRAVAAPRLDASVDAAPVVSEGGPIDAGRALDAASEVDAGTTKPSLQATMAMRGYLRILAPQGAQILVDDTAPVGPLNKLPLAPGNHRIQFVVGSNKDSFVVTIEVGETTTLDKRDLYQARPSSNDRNRTVNPFEKKPAPR